MIILYIFLGLIALLLIRASMISAESRIEQKINIQKPAAEVFAMVVLLRNHRKFNKWTMTDPNVQIEYTGEDGTVGFDSHWKSDMKNVGEGYQKIVAIIPNQKIEYNLTFIKPFEDNAKSFISLEESEVNGVKSTLVKWGFISHRKFMGKLMQAVLNLEKMLGKDLQQSLVNLKNLIEK